MQTMSGRKRRLVTAAAMLGIFLAAVEGTIVTAAMPTITADLGGLELYSWVFAAFMFANTVTVPLFGKMADLIGRRTSFTIGASIFLIGSVLSGAAASMPFLVISRVLQGAGAGGLSPVALTIVSDIYPLEQRARMQGLLSSIWAFAAAIGPFTGGYLAEQVSWRWLFYGNIPFGLIAIWLLHRNLEEPPTSRVSIDYPGAALLSLLILSLAAASQAISEQWHYRWIVILIIAAVVFGWLFVRAERKAVEPIVPLSLFRQRIFAASNLAAVLTGMGMFGTLSFIPLYVQGVIGTGAIYAGVAVMPISMGWTLFAAIAGFVIVNKGYRVIAVAGTTTMAIAGIQLVLLPPTAAYTQTVIAAVILGAGLGLAMTAFIVSVQTSVPHRQRGIATSANLFARTIGGAIGVALMGVVLNYRLGPARDELQLLLDPVQRALLDPATLDRLVYILQFALKGVFITGLAATLLAIVAAAALPGGRADQHAHTD